MNRENLSAEYREVFESLTLKLRRTLGSLSDEIVRLKDGGVPVEMEEWVQRWTQSIGTWNLGEQSARDYTRDSSRTVAEWEDEFDRVGWCLGNLNTAYAEAVIIFASLEVEEQRRFNRLISLIRDLNDIRRLIHNEGYKQQAHLLSVWSKFLKIQPTDKRNRLVF